jgi:enoyl-[acyl-carrier-protein] reductase (NADH)
MPNGGAMVTLTYNGGDRANPNYNVMGPAKAALESSVRYVEITAEFENWRRIRDSDGAEGRGLHPPPCCASTIANRSR